MRPSRESGRNTRGEEGRGAARTPEDRRHEAQGAEGGKGGMQGVWAAPAREG